LYSVTDVKKNEFIKEVVTAVLLPENIYLVPTVLLKPTNECLERPCIDILKAATLEKINEEKILSLQDQPRTTFVEPVDDSLVVYHNDGKTIMIIQFFPSEKVKAFYEKYKDEGFGLRMCLEEGEHFGLHFLRPRFSFNKGKADYKFSNN